ncbi:choice-of-anchor D domain-containing protein [Micromonospora sp. LZ34]
MRMFRALLGMVVAVTGASVVPTGMALAAPASPHTALTIDVGDHGGHPVPTSGVYDTDNSQVDAKAFGEYVSFYITRPGEYVDLGLRPPEGQRWVEGQTYPMSGLLTATDKGYLFLGSTGRACSDSSGSVTVLDVVRDPVSGAMTSFAAAYTYRCPPSTGTLRGEIRWNSTLDYVAAVPDVAAVDLGRVEIDGAVPTRTVTVTSAGSVPAVFGAASLGGAEPAQFAISGDTCSGRTVAPGGTCSVTISTRATRSGEHLAQLVLPDNSTHGTHLVPLRYDAYEGVVGMYYPLPPQRLMDTRIGLGAPKAPIGPGQTVDLDITGRAGVPVGAGSVVLNVTVTGPTADSFLTVYPAHQNRPTASSINFPAGWLGSNNVTVKLGAGEVSIYNRAGSVHVVVDVVGFYAEFNSVQETSGRGGHYLPVTPTRLFDTRATGGAVPAGGRVRGWVDFGYEVNTHVRGLVLNVTAVAPAKGGFLTAWSGEGDLPTSSTVNYGAGKVVPNLAFVQTTWCGTCVSGRWVRSFTVHTSQSANVVVDLVGVIDDGTVANGLRFRPLSPTRIVDSRSGLGTSGALGPNVTRRIVAPATMASEATRALAMNVTAVSPASNTVITVWPADAGLGKPATSNLNPAAGQIVSNAAIAGIGPQDAFHAHNLTGSTHLVADVVGTFYLYPGTAGRSSAGGLALVAAGAVR